MTVTYFIAGSVFILLSLIWAWVKHSQERNKAHEDATKAAKDAVDAHDTDKLINSIRNRMRAR